MQPSRAVVEAVAKVRGVGPVQLDEPLFEAVDPDALDGLFDSAAAKDLSISFRYHGHDVELHQDMTVVVDVTVVESATRR